MKVLYTRKAKGKDSIQATIAAFEDAETLEDIKSVVESSSERVYATWASVDAVDSEKERIPIDDLIEQNRILMERGAPISDDHTNRIVGKTLSWKVLEHPETGSYGIIHLNQIYNHNELDEEIWREIKNEERGGSSVGGISSGKTVELSRDGKGTHRIEGFEWMETATTSSPVNPYATNLAYSVVAKSKAGKSLKVDSGVARTVVERGFKKPENTTNPNPTNPEEHNMNDTNKRRVYLKPGQEAPQGVSVQTGAHGGRFYETGGSGAKTDAQPSEAQALQMFQEGEAAENIIESLTSEGLDFEEARAAAVNAVRDYANDPANQMQMDAPSAEEVDEFVSYLESLNAEDLNLEGTDPAGEAQNPDTEQDRFRQAAIESGNTRAESSEEFHSGLNALNEKLTAAKQRMYEASRAWVEAPDDENLQALSDQVDEYAADVDALQKLVRQYASTSQLSLVTPDGGGMVAGLSDEQVEDATFRVMELEEEGVALAEMQQKLQEEGYDRLQAIEILRLYNEAVSPQE